MKMGKPRCRFQNWVHSTRRAQEVTQGPACSHPQQVWGCDKPRSHPSILRSYPSAPISHLSIPGGRVHPQHGLQGPPIGTTHLASESNPGEQCQLPIPSPKQALPILLVKLQHHVIRGHAERPPRLVVLLAVSMVHVRGGHGAVVGIVVHVHGAAVIAGDIEFNVCVENERWTSARLSPAMVLGAARMQGGGAPGTM